MNNLPIVVLLFLFSAILWIPVFNSSVRKQLQKGGVQFYKLKKDERGMYDAMILAGLLIMAIFSSILALATLANAIFGIY